LSDDPETPLPELVQEARIGGVGRMVEREIRQIDMSDFTRRKDEIADQLWAAATEIGFFQLVNHGIGLDQIEQAFAATEAFFALSHDTKSQLPLEPGRNAGWEYMAQVRPSTGQHDRKESYQITLPRMQGLWPKLSGFKATMLAFERVNWTLGMRVLSCFALKLGFDEDFFTEAHDPLSPHYQSTLRLLHYLPMEAVVDADTVWRAGAHTDFDCLTLLHQQPGQGGLQLCPGQDAQEMTWSDVEPVAGVVTCNIGDMLMRWSDDDLKSTLHRVRMPAGEAQLHSRYSLAFFCQANTDVIIRSPQRTYPPISAEAYLQQRVAANRL